MKTHKIFGVETALVISYEEYLYLWERHDAGNPMVMTLQELIQYHKNMITSEVSKSLIDKDAVEFTLKFQEVLCSSGTYLYCYYTALVPNK